MSSLQVLQNKAAKIISDRPLYSSASHALATLMWIPLEKTKAFPAKMCACLQMSKWTHLMWLPRVITNTLPVERELEKET